jgi:general secretion pathway protein A
MFLNHYQLHEQPFGVTPDPRYTYFTSTHREALASLAYGVEIGSGFAVMVAKPGMGKTTLLFRLLDYLQDKARTVFVFHTQCNSVDLLRYILADMKIKYNGKDLVEMHALLNEALISEARVGRTVVVAIDESQNLSHEVLETIRLLSDFETPRRKLLQIILCGQPQLGHKLAHPDLVQLRQRITVLCRLAPLSLQEVTGYIEHRLKVAGHTGTGLFTPEAVQLISSESRGIPRVINTLCSGALSIGCALGRTHIEADIIHEVLSDLSVDSLIEEMAAPPPDAMQELSEDQILQPEKSFTATMREAPLTAPLTQALAAALAVPTADVTTAERGDVEGLETSEIPAHRTAPLSQPNATMLAKLPKTDSPSGAAVPASSDIAIPHDSPQIKGPTITEIAAGTNESHPPALRMLIDEVLKGKGAWIVGVVFLAASLLAFTLYFGVPGMRADGREPATSDSASTSSLSGDATNPATISISSGSSQALPTNQHPIQKQSANAEPIVHVVQTNETLSGISVEYLGHYDDKVLEEVQKSNADLKDPDLIRVGQKVLLPAGSPDKNSSDMKTNGAIEGNP